MNSSLFLSYCRREVSFVNSLAAHLEKAGHKVWLDYHSLVPGSLWFDQILQGIADAEVFLLVVSKESMASNNAEDEWREALRLNKRIILVIFEAVELPEELRSCEWVDFRQGFRQSFRALSAQITFPQEVSTTPPETGFKAPFAVWLTFIVSLLIAILAVPTFWTIYIPYYLGPLPLRILKRDFNFAHVQSAILMLVPFLVVSAFVFEAEQRFADVQITFMEGYAALAFCFSLILVPLFLILIRLPGMQRWGKPGASRPRFTNRYKPNLKSFKPVRFAIDFAHQDKRYARALIRRLEKDGHQYVVSEDQAEIIIVLISVFKKSSLFNPEEKVVYPVILQDDYDNIDDRLKSIQWIDFRRGMRNMKAFSHLLSDPQNLVKALGVVPSGRQIVLPPAIHILSYYLAFISILVFGSTLFIVSHQKLETNFLLIILTAGFLLTSWLVRQSIVTRRGWFASVIFCWLALLVLGQFLSWQAALLKQSIDLEVQTLQGLVSIVHGEWRVFEALTVTNSIGYWLVISWALFCWRDVRRWFPARGLSFRTRVGSKLG